jgi:hypothetical protein
MRTGEAVSLLFKLTADGSQAGREIRRTRAEYVREVRAMETAGQRALTVLSTPIRGRLGFAGSLGISAARQALRSFATNEIKLATDAQKGAAAAGNKLELAMTAAGAATAIAAAKSSKYAAEVGAAAKALKFTRAEVDLFAAALARAERINASSADVELRGTFKRLGVNRVRARRDPETALGQFAKAFNSIDDAEDRASLATEVFGHNVAKILPKLESTRAAMLGVEGAAGAAASGMGGMASSAALVVGPLAAVAAIAVAVTAAYVGLAAVGIKATAAVSKVGEEIYRTSERTGIGAERLSVYRLAAQEAGISFDTFSIGITRFQQRLVEAAEGNKKLADTFKRFGIDAEEGVKKPQEAFDLFNKNFSESEDNAKKTAVAIELFGESGAKMIPVLERLGSEYEEIKKRAAELGVILTDQEAKALHEAEMGFKELRAAGGGLALTIGKEAAPAVTQLLRTLANLIKEGKPVARFIGQLSSVVIADLTNRVLNVAAAVGTIPAAVRGLRNVLRAEMDAIVGYAKAGVEAATALYFASQGNIPAAGAAAQAALATTAETNIKKMKSLDAVVQDVVKTYGELYIALRRKTPDSPDKPERELDTRDKVDKDAERARKEREESLRRARQQQLENEVGAAALAYKKETEAAEAEYEERLIDLDEYARRATAAEDTLLAARLANFKKEVDEARRTAVERKLTVEESLAEIAAVEQKGAAAQVERDQKVDALRRRKDEVAAAIARARLETVAETAPLQRRAEQIREALTLSNEQREQRAVDAERKRFAERRGLIEEELRVARRTPHSEKMPSTRR